MTALDHLYQAAPSDPAEVEQAVADALARLAEATGSARLRHAAAVLRGKIGGRRPISPQIIESALDEAEKLHREGLARSLNRAFLMVARTMDTKAKPKSTAELLRKRYEERKISSAFLI